MWVRIRPRWTSPFYNAVIGSRGSGKSTLIESIRLVMRKTEGLTATRGVS
nr:ATPase involved in DNA repair [Escherichia coli]